MDTWPTQGTPPQWQFSPHWRVLPGMAHGTRQPAMLGACDIQPGHWERQALDQAIAIQTSESPDEAHDKDGDDHALLRRLLFWSGAMQRQCKVPVFGAARIWRDPDPAHASRLHFALPYASADASRLALQWVSHHAQRVLGGQTPQPADVDAITRALQPFQAPGFNTIRFLQAADGLDLPWRGVVPGVFAYGQGHACRWLESSYTDRTPVLGTRLARDKFRTAQVMRQLGLPAPIHARAASAQQAVQLAHQIGYPVVVKPADRDQGQGVSADLRDDAAVTAAFAIAARCSDNILVEKHAHGNDYRLTILNGNLIKTIVRRPAGVVGDGQHTIAELVNRMHDDPAHQRASQLRGHAPLAIDVEAQELLAQHGMAAQSIPAIDQFVTLRRRANVSAGGTPELVRGGIHADNRRLAERAAQALQLDLAGVDIIMPDIGRSWLETGALICEVNGQPQLGSSTTPGIYRQVLRALMPAPCYWRIPVVLVLDSGTAVAQAIHAYLADRDPPWGLATKRGVWEGSEQVAPAQATGFAAARILAASRRVGGAVVGMAPDQLVHSGLPFDRIRVVVVATDAIAADGAGVRLLEQLWPMVLAHVDGAVVCAEGHAPSVPAGTAPDRSVTWHPLDDAQTGLADRVLALLPALAAATQADDGDAAP